MALGSILYQQSPLDSPTGKHKYSSFWGSSYFPSILSLFFKTKPCAFESASGGSGLEKHMCGEGDVIQTSFVSEKSSFTFPH